MPPQLSSHFVAFIDLLGFSEMVRADCESSAEPRFLNLLHQAHLRAPDLLGSDGETGLTQFSDSIVFSRPFDLRALASFISAVGRWQRALLEDGLLCRGGLSFGKHFVDDRFLFSKALIDAYALERSQARYPRIVISEDLLQLASPTIDPTTLRLVREDDGMCFVDYLYTETAEEGAALTSAVRRVIESAPHGIAPVQEKMRWLASYADHKFRTGLSIPRFGAI